MRSAIALRTDFTGSELRQLARYTRDANQARRLLALAVIYDGGSRSEAARRDRDLVRRRSQDRTEEQDHPSLGQTRNAARGAVRSAHRFHLHLRSHLSRAWQGCSAHPAAMQYRGDEPASGRDRHSRRAWSSRRTPRRPGGMAPVAPARHTAQHHARATAGEVPRTQPGREHLAIRPRQLALQPRVLLLRQYTRPLLRCLEQTRRSAVDHHVHRSSRLGT